MSSSRPQVDPGAPNQGPGYTVAMADVAQDYTDPLEAAVASALIELRPDIGNEGARAGAHVIVSGVDAAAGTTWPSRQLGYHWARSQVVELTDEAVALAARTLRRKPTTVHSRWRTRATAGLESLDTDELAQRAVGAIRAVEPPPQIAAR
jgi:hypothetical protein